MTRNQKGSGRPARSDIKAVARALIPGSGRSPAAGSALLRARALVLVCALANLCLNGVSQPSARSFPNRSAEAGTSVGCGVNSVLLTALGNSPARPLNGSSNKQRPFKFPPLELAASGPGGLEVAFAQGRAHESAALRPSSINAAGNHSDRGPPATIR